MYIFTQLGCNWRVILVQGSLALLFGGQVTYVNMESNFPVDCGNLSFSDNDEDASSLFITQSTFRDINTQDVNEAAEFFDGLGDVSLSEVTESERNDLEKLSEEVAKQKQDEMCSRIFDFSDDIDNGYTVSTQDNPIIVTRKSDGMQVVVPANKSKGTEPCSGKDEAVKFCPQEDLNRFKTIVSDSDIDAIKTKRYGNVYFIFAFRYFWSILSCVPFDYLVIFL